LGEVPAVDLEMNYVLSVLLAAVLLWLCSATKVEAPRSEIYRPAPGREVGYPMPCKPDDRICREIAKIKRSRT